MIKEYYPQNVYDLIKPNQLFKSSKDDKMIWQIDFIDYSEIWVCERNNKKSRHVFQLEDVVGCFSEGLWIPLIDVSEPGVCIKCNYKNEYLSEDTDEPYICFKCRKGY